MFPEQFLLTWNQVLWIPYDLVLMGSCSVQIILFLVSLEHFEFFHVFRNNLRIRLYFGLLYWCRKV